MYPTLQSYEPHVLKIIPSYVKPYRLICKVESDKLILLRFEHRKEVYER
jgi:hypothetical protein